MSSKIGKILMIVGGSVAGLVVLIIALNIVMDNKIESNTGIYKTNEMYDGRGYSDYNYSATSSYDLYEVEKIITENNLTIETKDINKTLAKIETQIKTYEGKIISKNVSLGDDRYGYLTVQIPSEKAAEFVDVLNKDFNVSSYSTEVLDVTEKYVNTEKEIENLQKKILLYEELAAQIPIKEIETRISIIDKIFALENQIEYLKEQNSNIDKKVEYRRVLITLRAPEKVQGEKNYWLNNAQIVTSTLEGSIRAIIIIISIVLPFVIIGIPVIVIYKSRKKKQ